MYANKKIKMNSFIACPPIGKIKRSMSADRKDKKKHVRPLKNEKEACMPYTPIGK